MFTPVPCVNNPQSVAGPQLDAKKEVGTVRSTCSMATTVGGEVRQLRIWILNVVGCPLATGFGLASAPMNTVSAGTCAHDVGSGVGVLVGGGVLVAVGGTVV